MNTKVRINPVRNRGIHLVSLKLCATSICSEFDMSVFGQAEYEDGILTDISLDPEDLRLFEYREGEGYLFEGQSYETDMEIMELLLERKKELLDNSRGYGR